MATIDFELPDLNTCSVTRLRMAARRLSNLYDATLAPSGLKNTQVTIMSVLARRAAAPPTIKDLSTMLSMDRSSMGQNLRPLERDGLVTLAQDKLDKRIRRVVLTPAGTARLKVAAALWVQAQAKLDERYGNGPAGELRELLHRLITDPAFDL